jgi:hypothetical protein
MYPKTVSIYSPIFPKGKNKLAPPLNEAQIYENWGGGIA